MRCPQCAANLNTKETVPLPRIGQLEATLCVFCSSAVALTEGGSPRLLRACASCGSPLAVAEAGAACEACEAAARSAGLDGEDEGAPRVGRDVFQVYSPMRRSDGAVYFERVLSAVTRGTDCEGAALRLVPVSDLGFKTVSLPDGTILAGREILTGLEDEAMLAFVFARELAHLQSGRVLRRYRWRKGHRPLAASLDWGLTLLTRGTVSLRRGDVEIVREVAQLGYGTEHEAQADEWAIHRMHHAGFEGEGSVRYLKMLESRHLAARGVLAAFVDIHPARSRRRCLAETLLAIRRDRRPGGRRNREAYRRAAIALAREGHPASEIPPPQSGRRAEG